MTITKKQVSEHIEQTNFINWFKVNYPKIIIFAIPNGGFRAGLAGAKLKKEGVLKGVSDLFIPELKLFIEMKRVKGSYASKEQKQFIKDMIALGYKAEIAKGFEAAKKIIEKNVAI